MLGRKVAQNSSHEADSAQEGLRCGSIIQKLIQKFKHDLSLISSSEVATMSASLRGSSLDRCKTRYNQGNIYQHVIIVYS